MDPGMLPAFRAAVRGEPGAGPRPFRRPRRHRGVPGRRRPFDRALAAFAQSYADQNERDFAELSAEAKAGRLAVRTGL